MDKQALEALVRQVLLEKLGEASGETVKKVPVPQLRVTEEHRMDTGRAGDRVYTRDLFTLDESPRLGAGIMEMTDSICRGKLNDDEMDYVIEGRLDIRTDRGTVSAGPGEVIYIPRGSAIRFSVTGHARFLYFVYPADWQNQNT